MLLAAALKAVRIMPPRRPYILPSGVTKRQTRSETIKLNEPAPRDTPLIRQIINKATGSDGQDGLGLPSANEIPTSTLVSDQVKEIGSLLISRQNEISQEQKSRDTAPTAEPLLYTVGEPSHDKGKGKEPERSVAKAEVTQQLINTTPEVVADNEFQASPSVPKGVVITAEELARYHQAQISYKPFDYSGKEANQRWEYIEDINARITEKFRVWWTDNWTTASKWLAIKPDKPALDIKLWKQIALGEFVDLAEFRDRAFTSIELRKETKIRTENDNELELSLAFRPKFQIFNIYH